MNSGYPLLSAETWKAAYWAIRRAQVAVAEKGNRFPFNSPGFLYWKSVCVELDHKADRYKSESIKAFDREKAT